MGDLFQPTHLLVLGVIVFLLFGAKRLPELGKGLGEGLKGFKDGIKNAGNDPVSTVQHQNVAPAQPKAEVVEQKQTPVA
jgi:sec-independent protein translocase protein TatA